MVHIKKAITITAPPDRVFRFMNKPGNLPRYAPNVTHIEEIREFPGCSTRFLWSYKMMGVRFEGVAQTTHCLYGRFIEMETRGGIRSKITWTFSPSFENAAHTNLLLELDYVVPAPLLRRFNATQIIHQNEIDTHETLNQLKAILEDRPEPVNAPQ